MVVDEAKVIGNRIAHLLLVCAAISVSFGVGPAHAQVEPRASRSAALTSDSLMTLDSLARTARNSRDGTVHYRLGTLAAALTSGLRDGRIIRDARTIDIMRIAEQSLGRAVELEPRNPEYALALAKYHSETAATGPTKRYADRARHLAREAGDRELASEAARLIAEVYWRRFDAVAYRRELKGISTVDTDALISTPEGARRFLADNTIFYDPPRGTGDLRQARELFAEALAALDSNRDAYRGLYATLLELGEYTAVVAASDRHAAALPDDAWALLARGAALQRLRREGEAGTAFRQGFALLDSMTRQTLMSLARILPRPDSLRFEHVSRARRESTTETFWRDADMLALTPANEIETEFYCRVIEAELRYSDRRFNRSGADTDRGTMWIRYGPPTVRATFATEMIRSADLTDGTPSRSSALQGLALELWYWEAHNLHLVFQGAPGFGVARLFDSYRQVASDARAAAPVLWSNVPLARYPLDSIPVQLTRFRHGDSLDLMITARVPLRQLARSGVGDPAEVDVGMFVTGFGGRVLERDSSRSTVASTDLDLAELRSWRTRLSPGTVHYRIEAVELSSMRGASARGSLPLVRKRELSTSDLLIAEALSPISGRSGARWTDFIISPSVGDLQDPSSIALLWETYGLAQRDGANRYRVQLSMSRTGGVGETLAARVTSGVLALLGRSISGRDSVAFTFDRSGPPREALADHLTLDLSQLPPGRYRLRLLIEDLVSGASASSEARELVIRGSH